jgi:type II secretory pathway pseudopilin PulG
MTHLPPQFPRGEQGFTLVEMLVTLVTGIVIVLAAFSILDVSLSQSSRINERVDADQRARLAMEKILLELHSSCVIVDVNPVEVGSESEMIKFISQQGSEAYFNTVTKHEIKLNKAAGTLTDASYASVEPSSSGTWTFPATATSKQTLLTNVSLSKEGEKTVPLFKYYKYENGNLATTELPTPLNEENAANTAEITVSFTTAPTSNRTTGGRTVDLADTAVLRFDPASATGTNEPCQ